MKFIKLIQVITIPLLFLLLGVVFLMGLNYIKKKDRSYNKKGTVYYLLILSLLMGLMGFLSLMGHGTLLSAFLIAQGLFLVLGIFHTWVLFGWFGWATGESFLPEFLFTLAAACFGIFGFLTFYNLIDHLLGFQRELSFDLLPGMLWFPIPFLVLKTYHYLMLIPGRMYHAWVFPSGPPPQLNLQRDSNIMHVFLSLQAKSDHVGEDGVVQRSRLPLDARIGDFFHNFINDFNRENPRHPIAHLNQDHDGNPLGWVFYSKRSPRNIRKTYLDPEGFGIQDIREGDYLFAQRVRIDPREHDPGRAQRPPIRERPTIHLDSGADDDIVFTEK